MKRFIRFRRIAAILLAAALLLAAQPRSASRAWAASLTIDDSGFADPQKTQMTVYVWKQGVPTNDERHKLEECPILMTWGGKYCFTPDSRFQTGCQQLLGREITGVSGSVYLSFHGWNTDNSLAGKENGVYHDSSTSYPHGAYWQNMGLTSGLLSNVDGVNMDVLLEYGTDTSFSLPSMVLPKIIPLVKDDSYAIRIDLQNSPEATLSNSFSNQGGFRTGENYLTAMRYSIYRVGEVFGFDASQSNGFYWGPYAINATTANALTPATGINIAISTTDGWGSNTFNSSMFRQYLSLDSSDVNGRANALASSVPWKVSKGSDGSCAFWTKGFTMRDPLSRVTHSIDDADKLEWLLNRDAMVALSHYDDKLESRGNCEASTVKSGLSYSSNYGFRCFYAEPTLFDFLQKSFTVESGQVTNLDGPLGITDKCTITVKDGGTLCVSGWVLNNGTIRIEEGGTLYVQDGACLNKYEDGSRKGGGVISNGLVLVGNNAKLIGGGVDGLQFLDGSHAVNFGCISSESFYISNQRTIENRSGGFVLYGRNCGVKGSGSDTYSVPLDYSGKTFAGKGSTITSWYVSLALNGVYDR